MRRSALCLLLTAVAASCGCGSRPEMGQVQGTIRIEGQPLAGVLVTFIPEAQAANRTIRSMGQTDDQGRYRLRAETQADGAVVGAHRVIIEDLAIYSAPRDADGTVTQLPPARFSSAFSDPLRSPLLREVASGEQEINLDLDEAP